MANAIAGVGTTFERWSGSAWQFIAEINAIEGPTMDKENIEVTALDTDGGYDEFITGFMEGGTLTLNMNFSRSGYELMKQDFEIDVARDYRITLPDDEDTTLEFEGLVTEIPITMEADNQLTADVTIQVSGEVTIASAGAESSISEDVVSEDSTSTPQDLMDVLTDGNTFAWYSAGDESTLTMNSEDRVSEWADKLGVGPSLAQAEEYHQPYYDASGKLIFNADSAGANYLSTGAQTLNQPTQIYALFKLNDWVQYDCVLDGVSANASGKLSCATANGVLRASAGISLDWVYTPVGAWRRYHLCFNGASSYHTWVGSAKAPTGDAGSANMGGVILGKIGGAVEEDFCDFEIIELIVRKVADNDTAKNIILDYLLTQVPA